MNGEPPQVLDVAAVMQRYRIRDRRAARRLMDEAGGFLVAGRLVVRWDDLEAYERRQREARSRTSGSDDASSTALSSVRRRRLAQPAKPLAPGWWRS
jgi:hypothetical protein